LSGLLVIEQSSTLSNLLLRTLRAGGHSSTAACHDFSEGLRLIKRAEQNGEPYQAVIVGVPPRVAEGIKPVLQHLQSGDNKAMPLLLVIHDKHPVLERWSESRGHSEIVPWQRFSRIPAVLEELAPEPVLQEEEAVVAEKRRVNVLFIDDSKSARYTYRLLLESAGFPVTLAASVGEAEKIAFAGSFDFIIVDYFLPDGTGEQLCRKLKAHPKTKDATLAIITGGYREEIIKKCIEAGAIECMFKNEAKELFLTRVNSIANNIETQKSVEAERQRLDGILRSVGDGVYGVDEQGLITFINPTGYQALGYKSDVVLVGRNAGDVFHFRTEGDTKGSDSNLIASYASGESLTGYETVFRTREAEALPVECTVFPLSIQQLRQGSVVVFRDISERKSVEQLRWEVSHDSLTGLSNRRHFSQFLEKEITRLRDDGGHNALLLIDIDRFADIIDAGGEAEGDRVLADVSSKLATRLRDNDLLARLETDKFALLLSGIQLSNVFTIADAFRSVLGETEYDAHGTTRSVIGSVGVVILSRVTPSAEYALEHARLACETAKKKGRNQTHIYVSEEDTRTARELESGWAERFKEAIRNDRFVFLAQPIIKTDSIPGDWSAAENQPDGQLPNQGEDQDLLFELLLRMLSKDGQWISPSVFIPLAERVNMIQDVDLWVIRNALNQLERLTESQYNICLTVNLSNVTLQDPDSLNLIRDVVQGRNLKPGRLIFEVTETAEIASLHNARKFMLEMKKLGVRFALDDFGTGFSSFSHLKHLPVDFIKIDGMFVQSMTSNDVDRTMVNSITSMAHSLGLTTIAEHVDSDATLDAARECKVDFVQGFFLGEPMLLDNLDLDGMFG
jgi:diguanylate cyclase (GGDEF)-like protein/PAS domain S-box-containing protein